MTTPHEAKTLTADQAPDVVRALALAAVVLASYGDEFAVQESRRFAEMFKELGGATDGRCVHCGCTEMVPCMLCEDGSPATPDAAAHGDCFVCGWLDATRTLCNAPACLDRAARGAQKSVSLVTA